MRITLVAGLPGSGKTTLLAELAARGAETIDDIPDWSWLPLNPIPWLAISDVTFCLERVREAAEMGLRNRYPGCEIEWTFFENDPETCLANAEARNDGRNVAPDIRALAPSYDPPGTAIPVFRPGVPAP